MVDHPGSGISILTKSLPGILPPLTLQDALETAKIHSVASKLGPDAHLITKRPYRSLHYTISDDKLGCGAKRNRFPGDEEGGIKYNLPRSHDYSISQIWDKRNIVF